MDLKIITKKLLLDKISYSQATKEINKQINECVKLLESPDLKASAEQSLRQYASKIMLESLSNLSVPANFMYLAIGGYRRGMKTESIVKSYGSLGGEVQKFQKGLQHPRTEDMRYARNFITPRDLPVQNVGELGVANQEYGKIYMERVKKALDGLIASEVKYDEHISLRNIAEMTVRYEKTIKSLEELKARGINLIVTSRHENCSKRCEKWQGGHYTLDNTYQEVDGIQFIPLKVATDQYVTTKSGKTYKNGHLTGYNCRHYAIPYKKGYEPPMVTKDVVAKQRAIDQRMRELERLVRHWKEKAKMYESTNFTKEYKNAILKVRYWKKQYEVFCRANRRAIEPSRIQIF